MKENKILAYHFTNGMRLRDDQELIEGKTYVHDGPIEICKSGLHASRRVIDALQYAPSGTLSVVECSGIEEEHIDKFVCRERKVLETHEVTRVLQEFALDVGEEAGRKHYNIEGDTRPFDAIRIARLFLDGEATLEDYLKAHDAMIYSSIDDAMSNSVYYAISACGAASAYVVYYAVYFASKYGKSMSEYNSLLTQRLQKVFKTSLDF